MAIISGQQQVIPGVLSDLAVTVLTARNTHFNQLSDTFPSEESVEKIMWLVNAVASTCITNDSMTQVHLGHYCLFRDMWKFSSKIFTTVTQ